MIQFNLLPDVKLEYIKARRLKRTVISVSVAIAAVAFAAFVLLLVSVYVVKPGHLKNLDDDIATSKSELEAIPDVSKILTIQNQLTSLPNLHKDKPVASRMFTYIQQLAPQKASISSLTINFDEQTIQIDGNAENLAAVNTFVDTLKFTTFKTSSDDQKQDAKAFSEVVLANFGLSSGTTGNTGKSASYGITLKYAPEIFNGDQIVELVVPKKVTTRSETERPADIFQESREQEVQQ